MPSLAIVENTLALAAAFPLTAQQIAAFPALPTDAAGVIAALLKANCPLTERQILALTANGIMGKLNDTQLTEAQAQAALAAAHCDQLTVAQLAVLPAWPLTIAQIDAAIRFAVPAPATLTSGQINALNS
jgi:hypothetical protein